MMIYLLLGGWVGLLVVSLLGAQIVLAKTGNL